MKHLEQPHCEVGGVSFHQVGVEQAERLWRPGSVHMLAASEEQVHMFEHNRDRGSYSTVPC